MHILEPVVRLDIRLRCWECGPPDWIYAVVPRQAWNGPVCTYVCSKYVTPFKGIPHRTCLEILTCSWSSLFCGGIETKGLFPVTTCQALNMLIGLVRK